MIQITLAYPELLAARKAFETARSGNALAAVKITRILRVLEGEARTITTHFDELGQRFAKRSDAGAPAVRVSDTGEGLTWALTGTPVYDIDLLQQAAADSELQRFNATVTRIMVPVLSVADLAVITVAEDLGSLLEPFADVT
jgi:hypothetical protein